MTQLVQVALAEDIAEAEELQTILNQAGISSELETALIPTTRSSKSWPRSTNQRKPKLSSEVSTLTPLSEAVPRTTVSISLTIDWKSEFESG